jgi:hypothetical protein
MPLPCKHPRFRAKRISKTRYVRLGFCGKRVVEVKKKRYKRRR